MRQKIELSERVGVVKSVICERNLRVSCIRRIKCTVHNITPIMHLLHSFIYRDYLKQLPHKGGCRITKHCHSLHKISNRYNRTSEVRAISNAE